MGDSWLHVIVLKERYDSNDKKVVNLVECLEAEKAGPVEDIGVQILRTYDQHCTIDELLFKL